MQRVTMVHVVSISFFKRKNRLFGRPVWFLVFLQSSVTSNLDGYRVLPCDPEYLNHSWISWISFFTLACVQWCVWLLSFLLLIEQWNLGERNDTLSCYVFSEVQEWIPLKPMVTPWRNILYNNCHKRMFFMGICTTNCNNIQCFPCLFVSCWFLLLVLLDLSQ